MDGIKVKRTELRVVKIRNKIEWWLVGTGWREKWVVV